MAQHHDSMEFAGVANNTTTSRTDANTNATTATTASVSTQQRDRSTSRQGRRQPQQQYASSVSQSSIAPRQQVYYPLSLGRQPMYAYNIRCNNQNQAGEGDDESFPLSNVVIGSRPQHNSHLNGIENQQRQPEHHPSSIFQPNTLQQRSNPIAIVRTHNDDEKGRCDTSDDDDEDDGDCLVTEDGNLRNNNNTYDGSRRFEPYRTKAPPHQSLPNLLLRAPRLSSLPSNDDYIQYVNMLPPPMALADTPGYGTTSKAAPNIVKGKSFSGLGTALQAYGSLRDSHQRGRFLDGPSSYRDGRTGDIRRIQHRVRFHEVANNATASAAATAPALSISDRILQRIKEREGKEKSASTAGERDRLSSAASSSSSDYASEGNDESLLSRSLRERQASGLTAMMESTASEEQSSSTSQQNRATTKGTKISRAKDGTEEQVEQQKAFYEIDEDDDYRPYLLSMSLTGLEVLQSCFRTKPISIPMRKNSNTRTSSSGTDSTGNTETAEAGSREQNKEVLLEGLEDLPLDEHGNNKLLSRSLSDPTPHMRRLQVSQHESPLVAAGTYAGRGGSLLSPINSIRSQQRSPMLSPTPLPLPVAAVSAAEEAASNQSANVYHTSFQERPYQTQGQLYYQLSQCYTAAAVHPSPFPNGVDCRDKNTRGENDEEPSDHGNPDTEATFDLEM